MPLLIDFFCGEGGAAMGYALAGWQVIGVDHKPQPRNPFPVLVCDFRKVDRRLLVLADGFHASAPCQKFTAMNNDKSRHRNLIPETREMLFPFGKPLVLENVMAAARLGHLIDPLVLSGTMFGCEMTTAGGRRYVLERKRAFEIHWNGRRPVAPPDRGSAGAPIANIIGGHLRCRDAEHRTGQGTGRTVDFPGEDRPALARALMGMEWATMGGMSEAVPPAYTRYLGTFMKACL